MKENSDDLLNFEVRIAMQGYLTPDDVREDLRLLADSMSTHSALAVKIGISPAYLCDVLQGRREPGPAILRFLKVKKVVIYHEMTIQEIEAK